MSESDWKPVRLSLLAATLVGALLVLGRAIAAPQTKSASGSSNTPSVLPQTVPLKGWQPLSSEPIKLEQPKEQPNAATNSEPDSFEAQRYQYRQNNINLDVEVRYMLGDGNNSRFLFVYTPIRAANANLQVKYRAGVGYYGVLAHKGRAYLSACVNPQGESTVTEQQFKHNSYEHDLQPSRVLPWVLGKQPLLDQRCLWTLMSVPVRENSKTNQINSETAFQTLEATWVAWHDWWRSNYPPSR